MTGNIIEGKFLTTLPEVVGYNNAKSMGLLMGTSMLSCDKALKELVKKADKLGCNAVVNVKLMGSPNGFAAYGDGVIVEEKPFNY